MDSLLVINKKDLEQLPLSWYEGEETVIAKKLKHAVGSHWDNNRLRFIDRRSNIFSLQIRSVNALRGAPILSGLPGVEYSDGKSINVWQVYLWDGAGERSLGTVMLVSPPDKPLPPDAAQYIVDRVEMYDAGKIHCSGCDVVISINEVAGRYFAGSYCKTCWETKWKAVEARETYD